jgi:transposase
MAKELVSDELWAQIKPLLPVAKRRRFRYPGRKPLDERKVLTGIIFVLRSGIPWAMLPKELGCGSGMSCWRYLVKWHKAGVWKKLHEVLLAKLQEADKLDWSRAVVDSASVRAVFGGLKRGLIRRIGVKRAANTISSQMRRAFPWPAS